MDAKPKPDAVPKVINGRINGRFAPGFSGNPGGSPEATRRAFNKRFLLDLAEDWQQHGREVFKRVRRESPAAYLKVCALLVPREMKFEHSGGVKAMTDEQLEWSLEVIKELIAQRDGANAKVIEGEAEAVPSLPSRTTPRASCLTWVSSALWFAEFERSMIRQRIKAGLKRAVAQGVKLGRPKIDSATERKVRKQLAKGVGILKVAKSLGIGTGTVQRISKEGAMSPRGAQQ